MEKVAAKYLGKGVMINTINDTHVGFLQSCDDGWLTLVYNGKETEINSDYIINLKAHPIPEDKKNAKK